MAFRKLPQVQAATINATSQARDVSDFSLDFDDADQDGLFSISEILNFS